MNIINLLFILLALTNEVDGENSLPNQKKIQLNELLKNLNKPAVKTIKSEDGDIVDCVDIHNQPALDHPLLKNHTIRMEPSFAPKWEDTLKPTFEWTWQKSGSCPEGTVPIRRISRDDILRANSIESFGKKDVLGANGSVETAGLKPSSNPPSYGTHGEINVWSVHVEPGEWSQSALIVGNTKGEAHSFIEAGWAIHPVVFGDIKTRVYAYWTADGYQKTGCYNTMCSGFVQVSKLTMLGAFVQPLSSLDGDQYEIEVSIFRDKKQSSWWLRILGDYVGYWPDSIFRGFTSCPIVNWGGAILNKRSGGIHTNTQMGSGNHPKSGLFKRTAYISGAELMNEFGEFFTPTSVEPYYTKERCYSAKVDWSKRPPVHVDWSKHPVHEVLWVYFGGSGGAHCDR